MTTRQLDAALIQEQLREIHAKVAVAIPLALEQYGQYVRQIASWLRDRSEDC